MKVRIIARFKNENFYQARLEANLTQQNLADLVGISLSTIIGYENFKGYPSSLEAKSKRYKQWSWIAKKLEILLKRPYDFLFPEEYRIAVDKKRGKPISITREFLELPEAYIEKNLILPNPIETYEIKEQKEILKETLESLTGREEKIIKLRFGLENYNEHTLEETADILKLSRERIRQIEARALRKLKHPSRSSKLRNFI